MRKALFVASFLSVLLYSCTTDFDVTTEWEDITIAYGLLDPSDTANYIKVNKAFLDKTTSALVLAQVTDSLYYQNLNVQLEQYKNGGLIKTLQLEKVDGNLEGFVKDSGIFANDTNYLYKTKEVLDQNSSYKLLITEADNGKVISSTTEVINDFSVTIPGSNSKVNFFPGGSYTVQWLSAVDGKVYELTIRFHYKEVNASDPSIFEEKYLDWLIFTTKKSNSTTGNENMSFEIPGDGFYTFLNYSLAEDPSVYRIAENLDFMFSVGGEEMDTYNQVTEAQQGLTSGTIQPEYTNIENGLGLFSSRFHKNVSNVAINDQTVDTLACSDLTKHLRFQNSSDELCF